MNFLFFFPYLVVVVVVVGRRRWWKKANVRFTSCLGAWLGPGVFDSWLPAAALFVAWDASRIRESVCVCASVKEDC